MNLKNSVLGLGSRRSLNSAKKDSITDMEEYVMIRQGHGGSISFGSFKDNRLTPSKMSSLTKQGTLVKRINKEDVRLVY